MYKVIISDLILAFIIYLVYIAFNGFSINALFVAFLFFVVLLLREFVVNLIKKRDNKTP